MATRTTNTSSTSNSATTEPWGPLQDPLKDIINQSQPLIGDSAFFTPPQQADHTAGTQMLRNNAQSYNNGADLFNQPLNAQTQFQPVMAGAQYDTAQGANTLHNYMGNRGQAFNQARADQWGQHRDAYLDGGNNPFLDDIIQQSNNDLQRSLKSQFTGTNRNMGSAAYGRAAADRLGQNSLNLRYQDYSNRYNQERQAFENQANQNDAYGYQAANNLYGSGINTLLQAAPTLDNLDTSRIAQREQVMSDRANQMLRAGDIENQLYQEQNINPTLQSFQFPMALLSNPSAAFRNSTSTATGSQSQPNNGLLGGLGQMALGGLGLFL